MPTRTGGLRVFWFLVLIPGALALSAGLRAWNGHGTSSSQGWPSKERAFVADVSRVTVLRLSDGQVLWESSLITELAVNCDGCFETFGSRLLVAPKDGTLQAIDTVTGRTMWTTKSAGPRRRFWSVAGNLVAVAQAAGDRGTALALLDPRDGNLVRTIQPRRAVPELRRDETLDSSSEVLISLDGQTATFLFGTLSPCAQSWDLGTAHARWTVSVPRVYGDPQIAVGDRWIAVGGGVAGGKALGVIDVQAGRYRNLAGDSGNKLDRSPSTATPSSPKAVPTGTPPASRSSAWT